MEKKSGTFVFVSGSPGASQIGNFLIKNKEFFTKHFYFKMKRIMPQEISKYSKDYKVFPALKIGKDKIYGEKDILAYLSFTVNPPPEAEPETYDEVIVKKNMDFTVKGGKFTFNDEEPNKEDFDQEVARKMAEYKKKVGGGRFSESKTTAVSPEVPRAAPKAQEDYDDDVEQYRLRNI
jgi:hypothetical protein